MRRIKETIRKMLCGPNPGVQSLLSNMRFVFRDTSSNVVDHSQEAMDRQKEIDEIQRGTELKNALSESADGTIDVDLMEIRGIYHQTRDAIRDVLSRSEADIDARILKRRTSADLNKKLLDPSKAEWDVRRESLDDAVLEPEVLETLLNYPDNAEVVNRLNVALKMNLRDPYNLAKRPQARLFLRSLFFGLSPEDPLPTGETPDTNLKKQRIALVDKVANRADPVKLKTLEDEHSANKKSASVLKKLQTNFSPDSMSEMLKSLSDGVDDIDELSQLAKKAEAASSKVDSRKLRRIRSQAEIVRIQLAKAEVPIESDSVADVERELTRLRGLKPPEVKKPGPDYNKLNDDLISALPDDWETDGADDAIKAEMDTKPFTELQSMAKGLKAVSSYNAQIAKAESELARSIDPTSSLTAEDQAKLRSELDVLKTERSHSIHVYEAYYAKGAALPPEMIEQPNPHADEIVQLEAQLKRTKIAENFQTRNRQDRAELARLDEEIEDLESADKDSTKLEGKLDGRKSLETKWRSELLTLYKNIRAAVQSANENGENIDLPEYFDDRFEDLEAGRRFKDDPSDKGAEFVGYYATHVKPWLGNKSSVGGKMVSMSDVLEQAVSIKSESMEKEVEKNAADLAIEKSKNGTEMTDGDFGIGVLLELANRNPKLSKVPDARLKMSIRNNLVNDELDLVSEGRLGESFNSSRADIRLGLNKSQFNRLELLLKFRLRGKDGKVIKLGQDYDLAKLQPGDISTMIANNSMSPFDAITIYSCFALAEVASHPSAQTLRRHIIAYLSAKHGQKNAVAKFADYVREGEIDAVGYEAKAKNHRSMRWMTERSLKKLKRKKHKAERRSGTVKISEAILAKAQEKGGIGLAESVWEGSKVVMSWPLAYVSRAARDSGKFAGKNLGSGLGNTATLAGAPLVNIGSAFLGDAASNLSTINPFKFIGGMVKTAAQAVTSPIYYPIKLRGKTFQRSQFFQFGKTKYQVGENRHQAYEREAKELDKSIKAKEELMTLSDHQLDTEREWHSLKWSDVETGSKQLLGSIEASNDDSFASIAETG